MKRAITTATAGLALLLVAGCGKPYTPPPPRIEQVELKQLLTDWQANSIAVTGRYAGCLLELEGFVTKIGENDSGTTYILLGAQPGVQRIGEAAQVFFSDPMLRSGLSGYPVGSRIRLHVTLPAQSGRWPRINAVAILSP